mgnify:CR=1
MQIKPKVSPQRELGFWIDTMYVVAPSGITAMHIEDRKMVINLTAGKTALLYVS